MTKKELRHRLRSQLESIKSIGLFIFLFSLCFTAFSLVVQGQFVDLTQINLGSMLHEEWATQIVSTPSGKEIISADVAGRVVIRDATNGKVLREVALPRTVLSLSLSSDGQTIAAGDATGTVSLIDKETGKIKNTFSADKHIVNALAWSKDGKFLAAGGNDGIVYVWSASEAKIVAEINPGHGDIGSLAFANSQLVIGMINVKERTGSIEVWDWQSKKFVREFDKGRSAVRSVIVSPDTKLIAAASFRPASLLSIVPTEAGGFEISLHIVPDSDESTPVAVWDFETGKRVASIEAETGARSIAFSPDGKMLACAGSNGTMIYDIASRTFAEIGRIDSLTNIGAIAFGGNSERLILAREQEPFARFGADGLEKLFNPFFTNLTMVVKEGVDPIFSFSSKAGTTKSLTGGSELEIWQIGSRTALADKQTWEAVRASFDNKPDEARKILQQVIKDYPKYGEAQRLYAVFFESKDLNKLQSLIEASVKSDPNCVACWRSLGDVRYGNKQYVDAAKSYEKVLLMKPEYGLVAGHLSEVYGSIGLESISAGNNEKNMSAAAEALNKALKLRPAEERFYTNLGSVHYFRADFDKDISLLLIAQRLRPDHARIYYNLGHAYRYKNDKKKALEAYKRYVQMGEEGEEDRVERARQFIRELSK